MQTTHQAVELIKHFESFRPDPYYDVGGVITIGYGTARQYRDGHPIQLGDEIDEPSAEEELAFHLRNKVEPAIDRIFEGVPLTFNKADALASFLHNLGHGNPKKYETLVRLIKDGASENEVCDQWCKYRMAGGQRQLGLYRRRLAEIALYKGRPWEAAKEATWATKWQHVTGDEVPAAPEDDPDLVIPHRGRKPTSPPTPSASRRAHRSPQTVRPEDVPYGIDPNAGLKPLEQSRRVSGYVFQQVGTATIRGASAMGLGGAGYVASDPRLEAALTALFMVAAVAVTGFVIQQYGEWKRKAIGEVEATQGLY